MTTAPPLVREFKLEGNTLVLIAKSAEGEPVSETRTRLVRVPDPSDAAARRNPLAGTWTLNVAKSKYDPANLTPKSNTSRFEITGNTIKATYDGVDAEGRATHVSYTAQFDGKDYPYTATLNGQPNPNQDGITWTRIDEVTYVSVNKLKGQVLTTSRIVVSMDGRIRTAVSSGKNAQGQTINNIQIWDRQ
jgi:hypothetical protein